MANLELFVLVYFVFLIKRTNFAVVIELEKHIEILLLTNDCVIVPGLGGFTASHVPARYDNNDNLYIPPSRTLGFNSKLNINDSLLVQSYSEAYDISFPEAFNRLENEITELRQHVYNEGSYELNDIGTLYLNDDGNIEFNPCEAGLLTPYLYSLSSFEVKRLSSVTGKEEPETKHVVKAANKLQNNRGKDKAEPQSRTNEEKIVGRPLRRNYILLRNIAAIIVLIISFLIFSEPVNDKGSMTRMSNFDTGIVHNLINNGYKNVTSGNNFQIKSIHNKKDEIVETIVEQGENQSVEQQDAVEASPYFCIVLASKVSKKNADSYVSKLEACGFDKAEVLAEKGKALKVVYGHYKTKSEAYNVLNDLKGNEPFYDAWVYQAM